MFGMQYRSAILDECLSVRYWCDELTQAQIDEILENHPEWRVMCVGV
jgi:hypothetical protein